jgi:hypothetical protein
MEENLNLDWVRRAGRRYTRDIRHVREDIRYMDIQARGKTMIHLSLLVIPSSSLVSHSRHGGFSNKKGARTAANKRERRPRRAKASLEPRRF